jgi:hypothetical protein
VFAFAASGIAGADGVGVDEAEGVGDVLGDGSAFGSPPQPASNSSTVVPTTNRRMHDPFRPE